MNAYEYDLAILIPARNEMFLAKTVEDLLQNIRGKTEILVALDGEWANPPVPVDDRVTVVYFPKSIGQRAATNQLCRLTRAKYIAKTDAHCAFDEGFDVKLMAKMKDDYTMVPVMKNLHVFDWVCAKCGYRDYQGGLPAKCAQCDNTTDFIRDVVWVAKKSPNSTAYRFDNTLHFQYFGELKKRPEYIKQRDEERLTETMGLQGSFFMLTRDKYWELDICDERHGSWGQQGVEVACKTWLSGGRVVCNHDTWYAHLFRTGDGFGFPYPNNSVNQAREYSRKLWLENTWEKAIHPLSWLIEKFAPVPDWDFSKGAVYYTDSRLEDTPIAPLVREQIKKGMGNNQIVSVSLEKLAFGNNIHLPLQRGYITMAKQILAGLRFLQTDIVFFCEHDVLYHPSHFEFVPPTKTKIYYNTNVWRVRSSDGLAIKTNDTRQLSGLCAYRDVLLQHFEKRVKLLEEKALELGEDTPEFRSYIRRMGFEPATHGRQERVDDLSSEAWESKHPNVDIRHGNTLTPSRWSKDQFRNKRYTEGWQETYNIPSWGKFKEFFVTNL